MNTRIKSLVAPVAAGYGYYFNYFSDGRVQHPTLDFEVQVREGSPDHFTVEYCGDYYNADPDSLGLLIVLLLDKVQ